jgi:hypothetical protein
MQNLAHLIFKNHEAHRVVNLGVRAVHRATDTGGVCGCGGHAERVACSLPETPESGALRAREVAFYPGRKVTGAGERARFRTGAYGGEVAVRRVLVTAPWRCIGPPSSAHKMTFPGFLCSSAMQQLRRFHILPRVHHLPANGISQHQKRNGLSSNSPCTGQYDRICHKLALLLKDVIHV